MKLANGGETAAKEQSRTLAGSTPAIRARKKTTMNEEFFEKLKGNSGLLSLHKTSEWLDSAKLLMRRTRCDFDNSLF